jgi:serine phosphatase RsbU (regulator of sigma subunit)
MMAKFSGDTRYCILTENAPGAAAAELNSLLFAAGIEEKFITLSLSVLDAARGTLALASAGHLPIIVRRADGSVEEVGETISGFPLGIIPGADYRQVEVQLAPGDVVVIYSDGVTDSRNLEEQLYDCRDDRRLLRKVSEASGGAQAVGKAILQDIREYSLGHEQADDITLICFGPSAEWAPRTRPESAVTATFPESPALS